MNQESQRLRLRVAAKSMTVLALIGVVYVFFSAFFSTDKKAHTIPSQRVVVGHVTPGESLRLTWEGRPVIIYRRTQEQIVALDTPAHPLADPSSSRSEQPAWADDHFRSREQEWFVALAVGTDLNCPVRLLPANEENFLNHPWQGGFIDECRGSRYDFAGRVYAGQYAERNLIVPAYRLSGDTLVLGGD